MLPALRPGDVLMCRPGAPLCLGAIYLFHDDAGLVAHRLVTVHPTPLFKGDRARHSHPMRAEPWAEVVAFQRNGQVHMLPRHKAILAMFAVWSQLRGRLARRPRLN